MSELTARDIELRGCHTRIAELERGLRYALEQWEMLTDTQRDYMGEPCIVGSNDPEALSYRKTVMLLKGLANGTEERP